VARGDYYSYFVYFYTTLSEYEHTIRPTILTEQKANRMFGTALCEGMAELGGL